MNTRLKEVRLHNKMSQKAFGEKIFLSQDQISLLEKGKRSITERTINDVCREFYINKEWLINGTGEMHIDHLESLDVDEDVKKITRMLFNLDEEDRDAIINMIELLQKKNNL